MIVSIMDIRHTLRSEPPTECVLHFKLFFKKISSLRLGLLGLIDKVIN